MVVKWSAYSPSLPTIQVRIPLKSTILIGWKLLGKNENQRKRVREWSIKRYFCIYRVTTTKYPKDYQRHSISLSFLGNTYPSLNFSLVTNWVVWPGLAHLKNKLSSNNYRIQGCLILLETYLGTHQSSFKVPP